jgi:hypothetical protein
MIDMGYYSRIRGQINIDPPLTWAEVRETGFDPDNEDLPNGDYKCVVIDVDVRIEETDIGTLTTKIGTAIVPASEEQLKYYSLADQMKRLCSHPVFKDRNLTGYIVRLGEDNGDVERYDGTGRVEKAKLLWPDGSEVSPL